MTETTLAMPPFTATLPSGVSHRVFNFGRVSREILTTVKIFVTRSSKTRGYTDSDAVIVPLWKPQGTGRAIVTTTVEKPSEAGKKAAPSSPGQQSDSAKRVRLRQAVQRRQGVRVARSTNSPSDVINSPRPHCKPWPNWATHARACAKSPRIRSSPTASCTTTSATRSISSPTACATTRHAASPATTASSPPRRHRRN